jgi:hypothetical protein
VTIHEVRSGKLRHILVEPSGRSSSYELRHAVFSPDGRMLAVESEDSVVDVWEMASGRRRRQFRGHRSYQTALAFSPDGRRLASGNRDATILVWDVFGVQTGGMAGRDPLTARQMADLWTVLRESDAEKACLAMGRLLHWPAVSGPFLKRQLLARKSPLVAKLKRWLAELDSDEFHTRVAASQGLAKHLSSAEPLLKETLAGNPSLEVRRRIERLLRDAKQLSPTPENLRDLRALEVIEHIGGKAADEVVRQLSEGVHDPVVVVAARAVRRRMQGKGH